MSDQPVSKISKSQILSWCLYDWANSVLATVIFTFVFAVYFARAVVGDETLGSSYWGYAVGIAGLVIAITGPILGAVSDHVGRRKPLLGGLTLITILSTIAMFWVYPTRDDIALALILVGICTIGFELAQAQYNAMLSDIASPDTMGRISGWAWAMGYFGGLVCLMIALVFFIGMGDGTGLLGISEEQSLNIRMTCLLCALWYGGFALPLFINVPDRKASQSLAQPYGVIMRQSIHNLKGTLVGLYKNDKNILRFMVASAIYRDGLNTLFTVGGLYAAGTFGMSFTDILIFAIGLNVTSGIGAFALSYLDDHKGAKPTILYSLYALIALGVAIMIVEDKTIFMVLAMTLGLFIGPVQSSSRSMMARLAPSDKSTELFGLYAMTGKSIAFTGPILFAVLTQLFDSQRMGILSIIGLWVIGVMILRPVKEEARP